MGGAKGGVVVDPRTLSPGERERLSRRYMAEMIDLFGPDRDVPAPDVNTGPQVMSWMMDTYIMHKHDYLPGVITGKPMELGGSAGRQSATSRGIVFCIRKAAARLGLELGGATAAIQGFGNVGSYAAKFLAEDGVKIVAISDVDGAWRNPARHRRARQPWPMCARRGSLQRLQGRHADAQPDAAARTAGRHPRARRAGEPDHRAERAAHPARIIAEGANGPTTPDADEILARKGVFVIPDILCNAGGVTVSYLEWVQNRMGYYWTEERVNEDLQRIMDTAFDEVYETMRQRRVTMRIAAFIVAIQRVAEASEMRGLYA